jgi:hypothetical protein
MNMFENWNKIIFCLRSYIKYVYVIPFQFPKHE